jgi:hypothetical protein
MDIGLTLIPQPKRAAQNARMAEDLGFASLILPDSQNLAPEVWGQLMLAAQATSRIRLDPASPTRHARPAVSAAPAAPAPGRAAARGVSSRRRLSAADRQDARPSRVERHLAMLQAYLRARPSSATIRAASSGCPRCAS